MSSFGLRIRGDARKLIQSLSGVLSFKFMPRSKKQKARLARALATASAVTLLIIFLVRDVVRENLKDLHDSLAQAEALYEIHFGQNDIAVRSEEQTFKSFQNVQNVQKFKNLLKVLPAPNTADLNDLKGRAVETLTGIIHEHVDGAELFDDSVHCNPERSKR